MKVLLIVLLTSIFLQIYAQQNPKLADSIAYNKNSISQISHRKEIIIDIPKITKKKGFNFTLGNRQQTIYRDNFTNRIYFQNGFDRTLIYQSLNTTK